MRLLYRVSVKKAISYQLKSEITQLLDSIDQGDRLAADQLASIVYEELRRLAAHKMSAEAQGHTLQPTALVHEAVKTL